MRCLKTGLYFRVGSLIYHCDMHGDNDDQIIILKGFARDPSEFTGGFHVSFDRENDRLVPSVKFAQFMFDWNDDYMGWENWPWKIDDLYCRFENYLHIPKV